MSNELDELKPLMTNMEKNKSDTIKEINNLRIEINKTYSVKNDTQQALIQKFESVGDKLKLYHCYKIRYAYLTKILVPDNIGTMRNIKIFLSATKSTQDYKLIVKKEENEKLKMVPIYVKDMDITRFDYINVGTIRTCTCVSKCLW